MSQADLPIYLKTLLYRGYDRGFLVIRPRRGSEFIQFSKRIDDSAVRLQFAFPRAPWSESHYGRLPDLLREAGFDFERLTVRNGATSEFLIVDLHQDYERAARLAKLCLGELFHCPEREVLRLYFRNVSALDKRIGFPDELSVE